MKKVLCLVMALMILAPLVLLAEETVVSTTTAVEPEEKTMTAPQQEMGMKMGMHKGMRCPCCKMMGKPSMEMAQDGSVVVLIGNKLLKYDANLTLVREVEIKMPEMTAEQCPMMGMMMEKAKKETKEEEEAKKAKLAEDLIAQPV